jgi:hypothetical protein
LFDTAANASRDLETLAALDESTQKSFVSSRLQSDFSLSATRAKAEGRDASCRAMLRRAAETNNTTPENMGSFFDQFGNL